MLLEAGAALLLTFADPRIDESSSLVASTRGDWLWTANDSGDSARLFAVDTRPGSAGRTLEVATLPGTRTRDLEDAAAGPDGALYLADTGDNRSARPSVTLLRVPEPDVDPRRSDVRVTTAAPQRTVLTYEDGPHDAETLLVHPRTGQVVVVTKAPLGSGVYAAPQPLADGALRRVGSVSLRFTGTPGGPDIGAVAQVLATGGAVSPDGRRLVVRTYTDAYVYKVPGDDLVAALRGRPQVVPLPETRQGEAVTWTRDGTALLTSSEGKSAPVHRVPAPPVPAGGSGAGASGTPPGTTAPGTAALEASPAARPGAGAQDDRAQVRPALLAGVGVLLVLLVAVGVRGRRR